jgi:hypothetical protein
VSHKLSRILDNLHLEVPRRKDTYVDPKERTLASVIRLMRTDDVMTATVKEALIASAGTTNVSDLAHLDGGGLAELLIDAVPMLAEAGDPLAVAERLLQAFERARATAGTTAQSDTDAIARAIKVQVEFPQNLGDMSLEKLLELLRDNPERADEILAYVHRQPRVVTALVKSDRLAIVHDGRLHVGHTLAYIGRLARDFTYPAEIYENARPTTFAKAAGTESRPYIHPFTGDPVEGPDELGFDFSLLSEELHNALLWARNPLSPHPAWPAIVDRFTLSGEVFTDPLPERWKIILDAYRAARADGDELALAINRLYPKELMRRLGLDTGTTGRRHPFGGSEPQRDEAWYGQQLRSAAAQAPIRVSSGDVTRRSCVLTSVNTNSGDITLRNVLILGDVTTNSGDIALDNVIVLGNVRTNSGDVEGRIYLPPSAGVNTNSGDNDASVYNLSYEQLYKKAVEWGLISE